MAIEKPDYAVIETTKGLEIRDYDPYLVAETFVEDEFSDAGNEGFRRLFKYITGANKASEKISMTAPVTQRSEGEKIAMTAPVGQTSEGAGHWVSFVVPSKFTMNTVPQPTDPRVRVREVPAQRMAVVRYSGFWSEKGYEKQLARLRDFMAQRGLTAAGEPQFARYDPPFMPPFMRRNEIMIPVAGEPSPASTSP